MEILIADDHPLVREGVKLIIQRYYADANVTEVVNYTDALVHADTHFELDLVLLDLNMPGMAPEVGIAELRERIPSTPIVILSASQDPNDVQKAIDAGAKGYIPKSATNEVLHCALELVLSGGVYLPAELINNAYGTAAENRPRNSQSNGGGQRDEFTLTPRQNDVLQLMVAGKTNKQIGTTLSLSEGTVRTHVSNILKGLQASNRTEAVRIASQRTNRQD